MYDIVNNIKWKCKLNSHERKIMIQVVKCALLQILVVKNAQHIDKKYAVSIIFCSCIHLSLDWDEHNHHFLENKYFQLLPHYIVFFILEYYLGWSQAQMPWDLANSFAFTFRNSSFCFHKLLRKHKLSSSRLLVFSNYHSFLSDTALSQKINITGKDCRDKEVAS
jgi:hypothetical protein